MGLPTAHAEVEEIAGLSCLVSKRFDRWGAGPGAERLHQESFAQALGIAPEASAGSRAPALGHRGGADHGRALQAAGRRRRARPGEGWYRRAIDDALLLVTHRMTAFFEQEADYMRPPGGERI